jgi:ATP-binding cassette subfamily B (MDR/TAP) protein 6
MGIQWQLSQKTGDILGILERGTKAITSIIECLIYAIFPTMANIIIAVAYLSLKFSWAIGITVFVLSTCYMWTTLKFTEWRSRYQNHLNRAEDEQQQQAMESLLNCETVKLFVNEEHETKKYAKTIDRYHGQEFAVLFSLNVLQLVQLVIVNLGLLVGSLLIVSLILNDKTLDVGDYVLFTSYMSQLILPLNWLGGHYRYIHNSTPLVYCFYVIFFFRNMRIAFANLGYMMSILRQQPKSDNSIAKPAIKISQGEIVFRNVYFGHESEPVLRGLSFKIPGKKTVALVKTTCL